jgi:uncharacterized caspase-like protein
MPRDLTMPFVFHRCAPATRHHPPAGYRLVPGLLLLLACILFGQLVTSAPSFAAPGKQRLALVVGVADYGKDSGLASLRAPVYDAEMVKAALENLRDGFSVEMITNDKVKDKQAFDAALGRFLDRIQPDDEVVFYFSGHGYTVPPSDGGSAGRDGNYYLLPSAKSSDTYLRGLPAFDLRGLDTAEKKDRAYRDWIANVALSEKDIEEKIHARRPKVLVIIADACRSLVTGTKGAAIVTTGVTLPRH